jgi:hypothetical protein
MALQKQHFDDNDEQSSRPGKRSRLTIDISEGLRRRVKMAAFKNDISISEYVGDILERNVPEETDTRQQPRQPISRKTLEHILQVRKEIMEHTQGKVFEDSTEIVRQMREERSQELEQL